ncbi:hypothetical protein GGI21_001872 [Coemansia aciculifera]|nr:hypothetical protein GGI21_001872 [Coemansia aciculifera]
MTAASSSSMMSCAMSAHHPPPSLPMLQQPAQKKHKHSTAGNTDRFHSARVHQEAFDGTNKLPLKPDDFSPHSADDQFSLLDPSNLPTFMMPMVGSSSTGSSMGFSSPGYQTLSSSSMPSSMNLGGNSAMYWNMPYALQSNQPGLTHSSMPSTDMSMLFSGLDSLSSTNSYSNMPPPPISPYGLPVPGSATSDPNALNSFCQTLMLLSRQGHAAPGVVAMPTQLGHQRQSSSISGQLHALPQMSPLTPAESAAALASSPPGSRRQMNLCVDTSAAALMSPPAAPASAFAPFESQGYSKPQAPSLLHRQRQQQQQPGAIFLPSDTNAVASTTAAAALATSMYPHFVAMAATDPAELFGSASGGSGNGSGVL